MTMISATSARKNLSIAYNSMLNEYFEEFMWDHVDDVVDIIFEDGHPLSHPLSTEDRVVSRELRMTMLMGGPL